MIKIKKDIVITIDGDEVKTLSNVCELARRALCNNPNNKFEFDVREINSFCERVWNGCGDL